MKLKTIFSRKGGYTSSNTMNEDQLDAKTLAVARYAEPPRIQSIMNRPIMNRHMIEEIEQLSRMLTFESPFGVRFGEFISDAIPKPDTTIPVQEIHDAFDAAAEKLVAEANALLADAKVQRAHRLRKLGFLENPDVKDTQHLLTHTEISSTIAPLIAKYRARYGKKFITLALAKELAKKYGLIVGRAKQFRGQIPEENLIEMETFMEQGPPMPSGQAMMMVAPYDNFATAGYIVRDGMLLYDPIVLYPVEGGYLIVTAWGAEAKDPLVTA